jgi:hypothetical protein
MNAFRILSPSAIILRGIKEKSIPYSKTFNHMKVAIMFECEKDAVYNIRRHTFPHLEKLVLLNSIHEYEHTFLKYEYYEKPPFTIFMPSPDKMISAPLFHNPYYTMNSTEYITDKEMEHVKIICDINGKYYKF